MNYSEWRAKQQQTLTLPSGLEIRVKKVSLLTLALDGDIPQTLHPFVDELLNKGDAIKVEVSDLKNYGDVVAQVIRACVIEPPIADVSDEEHLAIRDLSDDDRKFIFNWANRGASQLEKFRAESPRDVATLPHQRDNGRKSVKATANHG
jgi:hypothetical protein